MPYLPDERFNLVSQFRRASLSLSLNIAEGSVATNKENIRYLDIASRSLKRMRGVQHIIIAQKIH